MSLFVFDHLFYVYFVQASEAPLRSDCILIFHQDGASAMYYDFVEANNFLTLYFPLP